jgi:peptidoglycan/xylan/chitin deacetylase (PgdA/CDA1 family)
VCAGIFSPRALAAACPAEQFSLHLDEHRDFPTQPELRVPMAGTPRARRRRARARAVALLALAVVVGTAALIAGNESPGHSTAHAHVNGAPAPPGPGQGQRGGAGAGRTGRAERAAEARALRRVLQRTSYISVGSRHRKDVALTFDDGPGPSTRRILRILRDRHVPATFFVVGRAVRSDPAAVREELRQGDVIGNHTEDHPPMGLLTPAAQLAEVQGAGEALRSARVPRAPLFRPPYGSFSRATLSILKKLQMLMVLWTVDTKDFSKPGVQRIVYTALSGARGGAILLMHDGGGDRRETVDALPRIIRVLTKRGFHLVTVPQLVRDDPPPRNQPPPRSLSGG